MRITIRFVFSGNPLPPIFFLSPYALITLPSFRPNLIPPIRPTTTGTTSAVTPIRDDVSDPLVMFHYLINSVK